MSTDPARHQPFRPPDTTAAMADLRRRLRATRWPEFPASAGWSEGVDLAQLRDLVAYWADGFDWPAQETQLSRYPRRRVTVGGLKIHLVHGRAAATGALPLILTHGWPDSFWRYSKVLPLLVDPGAHGADPADAFDVVVPDIPGFGYSDHPTAAPLDSIGVADLWAEVMTALGYAHFGAAGGDLGSHVSRYLALNHPSRVVAVHRTDAGLPPVTVDRDTLSAAEIAWLDGAAGWGAAEGAYAAVHRTKPRTAAVGLNDSPAGLAAWIVEKMQSWSDGGLGRALTRDEILTNVTIYWLTGTIGSSMRMYRANAAIPPAQLMRRVEVPSGFSLFPGDIVMPPREWLERSTHLTYLGNPARGGHFAAFEEPESFATELREFFRPYRDPVAG